MLRILLVLGIILFCTRYGNAVDSESTVSLRPEVQATPTTVAGLAEELQHLRDEIVELKNLVPRRATDPANDAKSISYEELLQSHKDMEERIVNLENEKDILLSRISMLELAVERLSIRRF